MRSRTLASLVGLSLVLASCKNREVPSSQALGSETLAAAEVPATLYHFGERRYLRDLSERPAAEVTGRLAQFPSFSYPEKSRRGLYGAQHPGYAERYGMKKLGRGLEASPWLMTIRVKAECRSGPGVLPFVKRPDGTLDARLEAYLSKSGRNVPEFRSQCFGNGSQNVSLCDEDMDRFYRQENIRVAFDSLWPGLGFWVIRDPACIESVETRPAGLVEDLARVGDLWSMVPFRGGVTRDGLQGMEFDGAEAGTPLLFILASALIEEQPSAEAVQRLVNGAKTAELVSVGEAVALIGGRAIACAPGDLRTGFVESMTAFRDALVQPGTAMSVALRDLRQRLNALACAPRNPGPSDEDLVKRRCHADAYMIKTGRTAEKFSATATGPKEEVRAKALSQCREAYKALGLFGCRVSTEPCSLQP